MSAAAETIPAPKVTISRKERRQIRLIREQQERTTNTIPKQAFRRVVNDIVAEVAPDVNARFSSAALHALQTGAEDEITRLMSAGYKIAQNAKRDTLYGKDIKLAASLRDVL